MYLVNTSGCDLLSAFLINYLSRHFTIWSKQLQEMMSTVITLEIYQTSKKTPNSW